MGLCVFMMGRVDDERDCVFVCVNMFEYRWQLQLLHGEPESRTDISSTGQKGDRIFRYGSQSLCRRHKSLTDFSDGIFRTYFSSLQKANGANIFEQKVVRHASMLLLSLRDLELFYLVPTVKCGCEFPLSIVRYWCFWSRG